MPYCYYTCNLIPFDLLVRAGYTPRWLGHFLRDPSAPSRRDALGVHPMTCPYVTKLVAAADVLLGGAPDGGAGVAGEAASRADPRSASDAVRSDCLVVPGGCDAARRMGDLLAAAYPDRVIMLPLPRSSGPEVVKTVAADLHRVEDWLTARRPGEVSGPATDAGDPTANAAAIENRDATIDHRQVPSLDYPMPPRHGGVFVVAGPLTDDSLLRLIGKLGAHVAGLESCTSPDRWRLLATTEGAAATPAAPEYEALAARLLEIGMCPRRSTTQRRDYLARRLDQSPPGSIIYARQSFCDPGAYDALLVAELAKERGIPYLEIEVDFPFDAGGPLRTRVEAFLEAQLLDDDLLGDGLDDDLFDDPGEDDLLACGPGGHSTGAPDEEV